MFEVRRLSGLVFKLIGQEVGRLHIDLTGGSCGTGCEDESFMGFNTHERVGVSREMVRDKLSPGFGKKD